MFVRPVGKVRDPITRRYLPESGKEVPESVYWTRRLKSGCVILASPSPEVVMDAQITDDESENG